MPSNGTVRAVLWDADGVLQQGPGSWEDALGSVIGSDAVAPFGEAVWQLLEPALTGEIDMAAHVGQVIDAQGLGDSREAILEVWQRIEPLPESRDVVSAVRAGGVGCYLATNQDTLRAAHMRRRLAYDVLLDGSYYSCDLGTAKPLAGFFTAIADDLGLRPSQLLFVDDLPENVAGARAVGLAAELWHHRSGIDALTTRLAAHGIEV
jgi:putative hydrolase of the HAD superfamily